MLDFISFIVFFIDSIFVSNLLTIYGSIVVY